MAATAKAKAKKIFVWEGKDKKGIKVKGEVAGASVSLVKAGLRNQGIIPVKVKRKSKPLLDLGGKKKIKPSDIAVFARQLATMIQAGVPLFQSLDIISNGNDNSGMRDLVNHIKSDIESGSSLTEAMRKHPRYFDDLFCNLIESGEQSGALEQMMDRIATYKEKSESLKRKIKKALFYPTAVVVVAVIVTSILLIFVVPQFEELFKGFGADLPAFTQFVISVSDVMQSKWFVFLGTLLLAMWLFKMLKVRSAAFCDFIDRATLRIPVIGNILHKAAIARYARTLATTFAAGVPLVEALESVAGATGNVIYRKAVLQIKDNIATGQQMQSAMEETKVFPNMVVQMVAIGEESGALDAMLEKVANIYEEEVDAAVDGLSSLLEPLIMAILGVVVGGLVVAMYLPIFKMGAAI